MPHRSSPEVDLSVPKFRVSGISELLDAIACTELAAQQRLALFVIQFLVFVDGLAGEVDAEFLEDALVDLGEDDTGVCLQPGQLGDLVQGQLGGGVGDRGDGEGDQQFIQVQERAVVAEEGNGYLLQYSCLERSLVGYNP